MLIAFKTTSNGDTILVAHDAIKVVTPTRVNGEAHSILYIDGYGSVSVRGSAEGVGQKVSAARAVAQP